MLTIHHPESTDTSDNDEVGISDVKVPLVIGKDGETSDEDDRSEEEKKEKKVASAGEGECEDMKVSVVNTEECVLLKCLGRKQDYHYILKVRSVGMKSAKKK